MGVFADTETVEELWQQNGQHRVNHQLTAGTNHLP